MKEDLNESDLLSQNSANERSDFSPKNAVGPPTVPAHASNAISGSYIFAQLFWIFCCGAFVFGLWQIGPIVAERYQFAVTRGKVRAEYENAKQVLKDKPLLGVSYAYQKVAQKIKPSVVSVECEKPSGQGQGSGVILTDDGYIITNRHVVEGANRILVTLFDRRIFQAIEVGKDAETDLAVLKIKSTGLIPAEWGNSNELAVGSMVWAVGSPYGFEQTVTSGIVSGKNRLTVDPRNPGRNNSFQELLQTDAAINPGNSGGPLVDSNAQVVGINTSILGDSYQGISFAVPSSVAEFVFQQLMKNGTVRRGFLGFTPKQVSPGVLEALHLPDLKGAFVSRVYADSPAAIAGLQVGDIVRTWNGEEIGDFNRVYNLIAITPPNNTVNMDIIRNGKPLSLRVTIMERPDLAN